MPPPELPPPPAQHQEVSPQPPLPLPRQPATALSAGAPHLASCATFLPRPASGRETTACRRTCKTPDLITRLTPRQKQASPRNGPGRAHCAGRLAGLRPSQPKRVEAGPAFVKIADVARHADVSPGTESHVLNGKRSIPEQPAARCWSASGCPATTRTPGAAREHLPDLAKLRPCAAGRSPTRVGAADHRADLRVEGQEGHKRPATWRGQVARTASSGAKRYLWPKELT